jgi:hypothetical protein
MAAQKSAKYPFKWSDGTWHSITEAQHKADVAKAKAPAAPKAPAKTGGQTIVPPGTYDPSLDAALGQQQRGLQDLVGLAPDTATGDYGGSTGTGIDRATRDLIRQTGYYGQDLQTGTDRTNQQYGRSLDDLLKQRERDKADYGTNLATLQRNYDILGSNQSQNARKAGVASGGAIQQAMDKRTANQAIDKAPIDLAFNRALEDSTAAQTRLGQDQTYDLGQLQTTYNRGVGELGISTGRQIDDAKLAAQQAIREGVFGAQDIQNAKLAQFQQLYPGAKLPTVAAVGVKTTTAPTAPHTLVAAPGAPGVKKIKKGKTVTYTTSVLRP